MPTPDMRKIAVRSHVPAADTAAVVTLAAVPGYRWRLVAVTASYSAAPTGGGLLITGLLDETVDPAQSSNFNVDIAAAGVSAPDVSALRSRPGADLVVTLAAGAGSVEGKHNVTAIREPENE